jgi:hypothetical protein
LELEGEIEIRVVGIEAMAGEKEEREEREL